VRACNLGATQAKQEEGLQLQRTGLELSTNSLGRLEVTAKDVRELKVLVEKMLGTGLPYATAANSTDANYPGFSVHCLLRLNRPVKGRDNFLFDAGQGLDHARFLCYVDSQENLCLKGIDNDTSSLTIKVPPGLATFRFGLWSYLVCEFGSTNGFSFLHLVIDGREVASKQQPHELIIGPDRCDFVLGADLDRKNGGVFDMISTTIYSRTTTAANRAEIIKTMDQRLSEKSDFVSFLGNQFLESRSGSILGGKPHP
jgi:hypothetical protein